jgi:hypothetical protein
MGGSAQCYAIRYLGLNIMRSIAGSLLLLFLLGFNSAFADALSVSKLLDEPFAFLSGNACTKTHPGSFFWYANLHPAVTSLSADAQTRVIELINRQVSNPSSVTKADDEEFKSFIGPLLLNVRLTRGTQIVARCRVSPTLVSTASTEGADKSTPVIQVNSRTNCRFAKRDTRKLKARDRLTVRQGGTTLISERLRKCDDGCGVINCE